MRSRYRNVVAFVVALWSCLILRVEGLGRAPMANGLDLGHPWAPVPVSALIVEPRCHPALPLVVANMHVQLPGVPIQIFYGADNSEFVNEVLRPQVAAFAQRLDSASPLRLTLTPLPGNYYEKLDHDSYSLLFAAPDFWDSLEGEQVLVFNPDSWVCTGAAQKLVRFSEYDYVGAPWNNDEPGCSRVGNGGFSLRSRSAMRNAATAAQPGDRLQPCPNDQPCSRPVPEDVFFCRQLARMDGAKIPEIHERMGWLSRTAASLARRFGLERMVQPSAEEFAVEEHLDPFLDPLGVHRPWAYDNWYSWKKLEQACPGLDIVRGAQNSRGTCAHGAALAVDAIATYERLLNGTRNNAFA